MENTFILLGGLSGALGVALGAFGAHGLKTRLTAPRLETFETAVRYQVTHALALVGTALAAAQWPASALPTLAGGLFVAGTLLFSGSLYLLIFTGQPRWGAVTPLGGAAFIAGWVCLGLTGFVR